MPVAAEPRIALPQDDEAMLRRLKETKLEPAIADPSFKLCWRLDWYDLVLGWEAVGLGILARGRG